MSGIIPAAIYYGTAEETGIGQYLTVWGSGKININTAPQLVLAALPGMTSAMAEAIVRHRLREDQQPGTADDRHFQGVADLLALDAIDRNAVARFETLITMAPTAFRVIATGRVVSGQGVTSIDRRLAIIDRASRPTRIQHWRRLS